MKHSLRKILYLLLVLLIIPLFSLNASAEDYSAELHSLHFDIVLQEDGSAYITETREVVFSGDHDFSHYSVNNLFAGPRAFVDWEVSIDGTPASQLDEPDNDNRPKNTFAVEDGDGENTVHIYFRQSDSGTRVFKISYRLENAVKLYSDVGDFFWNLTGENGISDIGTLTATLTVPEDVPDEDFLIWAHGPLNGTFNKQSENSAFLQIENVSLGTIVDIRCTLPADFFYGGWEQQGEGLDQILAYEKELADSANAKREEEERRKAEQEAYWAERRAWEEAHPVLNSIEQFCSGIMGSVWDFLTEYGLIALVIIIFGIPVLALTGVLSLIMRILKWINIKRFRKHPTKSPQYYRDLPDDRPAPVVERLVHFYDGKSDISRQISATLLELNLKKLIHFRTTAGDAELLLNERLGEELFPTDTPQEDAESAKDQENIKSYQEILWDFIKNAANKSGKISIKDFKQYIKDNRDAALDFRNSFAGAVEREYTKWVKTENTEKASTGAFKRRLIFSAAVGLIAMLFCMFSSLYDGIDFRSSFVFGLITFAGLVILLSIIRFLINFVKSGGSCIVLDQQGEDDLALWQAFGRFLDDFTTFEDKELPEFSVWREYMVYAVAMGNGQKVAKALAVKYPESVFQGTDTFDDDMYRWLQDMALYDAMASIGREVAEIQAPSSSSSDDSNWSDSDGGGGGFSDSGGGSDSGSGGDFID